MAQTRTKTDVNGESFHQRYSELSDEIRAKNKREDRLLDIRLKYYEREKNIRLNILRKTQHQLERARSALIEQLNQIDQEKQKSLIPLFLAEKAKLASSIVQLSVPNLFNTDWEQSSHVTLQSKLAPPIPKEKPLTPKNLVRPHSAG